MAFSSWINFAEMDAQSYFQATSQNPLQVQKKMIPWEAREKECEKKKQLSVKRCLSQEPSSDSLVELFGAWSSICQGCGQMEMQ